MKIDLSKLKEAMAAAKSEQKGNSLPAHKIWIPMPEKETAKSNGAKWDRELESYVFHSANPEVHFCAKYLPTNYAKLNNQVPYDASKMFKEVGVVTVNTDGVWDSYVMLHEDYLPLVAALQELELL